MNCKPGDMAEVIGCNPLIPEVTGTIVTVLRSAGVEPLYGPEWWCMPAWPIRAMRGTATTKPMLGEIIFPDSELRPIRPPETPVTTDVPEELTA